MFPWMASYEPVNIIAILALASLVFEILAGFIKIPERLPHFWLQLGVMLGVIMSHAAHTYLVGIIGASQHYGKRVVFFVLLVLTVNTLSKVKFLVFLVSVITVIIAADCYLQSVNGVGFSGAKPLVQAYRETESSPVIWMHRPKFYGIFDDPNDTALLFVAVIPLLFAFVPRIMYLLVLPLAAFLANCILITDSRGGLLGFGIVFVLSLASRVKAKYTLFLGIAGIFAITWAFPLLANRGLIDESSMGRVKFWGEANYYFKSNPIFGVGYGLLGSDYMDKDRAVHNSFVTVYAEMGLFGYFFWFSVVALAFLGSWYISRMIPEDKMDAELVRFGRWLTPCLGGYFATAYFLTRAYKLPLILVVSLAAILYRLVAEKIGYDQLNERLHVDVKHVWQWSVLSVSSILFIYFSILILNKIGS